MEKAFASPSRYIQGKGVLKTGVKHIEKLGNNALLLCGNTTWKVVGEAFHQILLDSGLSVTRVAFNGESSMEEVNRVTDISKAAGVDVVLGLGGGKVIDTAKAIADSLQVPVAILPTIASSDAPTSALSVIYTEDGTFEQYLFYKKNPELVLIDTEIISKAPVRMLVSGIADAFATWVEGRAVLESKQTTMAGGHPTLAAAAIAQKCEEVLFEHGLQAVEANQAGIVNDALEAVVEANTLLSGIGFESCGLAAAHSIHNGFTALHGPIHELTHGEKVAYGILTQLFLEKRSEEELNKYIHFFQALGLPTTLEELKLADASRHDLLQIGQQATAEGETIHNMPFSVSAAEVADALEGVNQYVLSLARK
ncbi:MAG: glycerol dehydrogenase [Turicibacter sp.]|nr:glycerol dehydrogenase [Turicibacter sp.]